MTFIPRDLSSAAVNTSSSTSFKELFNYSEWEYSSLFVPARRRSFHNVCRVRLSGVKDVIGFLFSRARVVGPDFADRGLVPPKVSSPARRMDISGEPVVNVV